MSGFTSARVSGVNTWQRLAGRLFAPVRCRTDHDDFEVSCQQRNIVRGLDVSRLRIDAHSAERTSALAADGTDDLMLVLPSARGRCALSQHGRSAILPSDSITLLELDSPFSFTLQDQADDLMLVQVSRSLLGLPRHTVGHVSGRPIEPPTPGQPTLHAVLGSLSHSHPDSDVDVAANLADVTMRLIATVINAFLAESDTAPTRETQLAALRASMHEQMGDPSLTVSRLASQHFLSVRQVHALFAEQGQSPAAYLRGIRLARAARMLSARGRGDSGHSGPTLRSIAHDSGYTDVASFSRAFAREHGERPGRWAAPTAPKPAPKLG